MKFYTRKRKAPNVIIVSLIDILAILLIFFIVTTTFKKSLPQLKIALPESRTAATADTKAVPFVLEVQDAQNLRLDGKQVGLEGLSGALREIDSAHPGRGVAMQADENVPFGVIVKVLDAFRSAGIKNLPAFARPEGAQ